MDRCEELREHLAAYADGELSRELDERVRVHVETCGECRREYEGLKRVAELFRETAPPEVSAGDWEKVSAALDETMAEAAPGISEVREGVERKRRGLWWLFPASALAAAVLIVGFFLWPGEGLPAHPSAAQVLSLETDPAYEAMVRLPVDEADFLVIDVMGVE